MIKILSRLQTLGSCAFLVAPLLLQNLFFASEPHYLPSIRFLLQRADQSLMSTNRALSLLRLSPFSSTILVPASSPLKLNSTQRASILLLPLLACFWPH